MKAKTITEVLTDHHQEMRELIEQIKEDQSKFIVLKKHLDIHHELEEDLLLNELNGKKDIKDESLESQEEHFVLNVLLLDLADFPIDNFRWMVKFKVLEEIINHHLDEEEEDLFPEVKKYLPRKKLIDLGTQFQELKKKRLLAAMESSGECIKRLSR